MMKAYYTISLISNIISIIIQLFKLMSTFKLKDEQRIQLTTGTTKQICPNVFLGLKKVSTSQITFNINNFSYQMEICNEIKLEEKGYLIIIKCAAIVKKKRCVFLVKKEVKENEIYSKNKKIS